MKSNAYFVLYLMVVLEILIVIVDRDDAESELIGHLLRPHYVANDGQVIRRYAERGGGEIDLTLKLLGVEEKEHTMVNVEKVLFLGEDPADLSSDAIASYLQTKKLTDLTVVVRERISKEGVVRSNEYGRPLYARFSWGGPYSVGVYKIVFKSETDRITFIPDMAQRPHSARVLDRIIPVPFGDWTKERFDSLCWRRSEAYVWISQKAMVKVQPAVKDTS